MQIEMSFLCTIRRIRIFWLRMEKASHRLEVTVPVYILLTNLKKTLRFLKYMNCQFRIKKIFHNHLSGTNWDIFRYSFVGI